MENLFDTDTDYEEMNDTDTSDRCPHCGAQLYFNNEMGHRDCLECGYWGN